MAEVATRDHTLPASWWVSEKIYKLEKRAIFSKVSDKLYPWSSLETFGTNKAVLWPHIVMDPRNAHLSFHKGWRLLSNRYRWISYHFNSRKRWNDSSIPQCLSTQGISDYKQGLGQFFGARYYFPFQLYLRSSDSYSLSQDANTMDGRTTRKEAWSKRQASRALLTLTNPSMDFSKLPPTQPAKGSSSWISIPRSQSLLSMSFTTD